MKITPLFDRVLIRPNTPEEKTKSGIVLPETSKDKPGEGVIVAVGAGMPNYEKNIVQALMVKEGQKVMFSKYAPVEVKVNEENLLLVHEKDILAILED